VPLIDGLPHLTTFGSQCGAFIPSESDHASCTAVVVHNFFISDVIEDVAIAPSNLWNQHMSENGYLKCITIQDLVCHVQVFLGDILAAMKLKFFFSVDFNIRHVAAELCVITDGHRLLGVVSVKKPQPEILDHPNVLGELFDQMLLLEGFYMSGPIIGILTSFEEWRFCWFQADNDYFCSPPTDISDLHHFTSQKVQNSSSLHKPPEMNPSREWAHELELEDPVEEVFDLIDWNIQRVLFSTPVIKSDSVSYPSLLNHIFSTIKRISTVKLDYHTGVPRCFFKLRKNEPFESPIVAGITFHPACTIPVETSNLYANKFPRSNTKYLLAIEDLGRGASGKAWLACTLSRNPAVCVLKFHNKALTSSLLKEKQWWDVIYPEFRDMIKVESWSASDALVMPHFCPVLESERKNFYQSILDLLTNRFNEKGVLHGDVKWRNIGFYLRKGEKVPVIYDLETVRAAESTDANWVDRAMIDLYSE
jgi:hypothetical protein